MVNVSCTVYICLVLNLIYLEYFSATNLCFSEKNIYTQEVLAVVMKTLMEQDPLPTLFMRTVLQSLSMYPRLMGFILNILQRLISKEVHTLCLLIPFVLLSYW